MNGVNMYTTDTTTDVNMNTVHTTTTRTIQHIKTAGAMIMLKMDSDDILVETHLMPLLVIELGTMATIGTDVS